MNNFTISSISTIKLIDKEVWNSFIENETPFLSYEFLLALEESGCTSKQNGWEPNHIIIQENKNLKCLIPNYKKNNSNGEYVFDFNWAEAYMRLGLKYYPKLLSAVPFTPINGKRIFIQKFQKNDFSDCVELLRLYIKKQDISSFHINFAEKKQSDLLNNNNFFQRTGIQYHWKNNNYDNFNEFLSTLKNKKKKNILKERNFLKNEGFTFHRLRGREILKEDWEFFYNCYTSTIEKKWSYKYLNFDFFLKILNSKINERILLILAKDKEGVRIACSLSFIGNDNLFGRYWGCIKEISYLHFEVCYYQSIEFAINNKLSKIEAGAQGEHKISRGYIPTLTYSNHWIKDNQMSMAIDEYLKEESKIINQNYQILKKSIPYK